MTTPTPPPAAPDAPARRCQNCGEPLLGEHCYACGQPTRGLVRHFSSIIGDFMDSVFELDSRILRTVGPLLLRPGHLTLEYFAGRRVRYVSPVRLFVFLSLLAFFAAKLSVDINLDEDGTPPVIVDTTDGSGDGIGRATTVAQVEAARDRAIAELRKVRTETATIAVPGMAARMDAAEQGVTAGAVRRIAVIERAAKEGTAVPETPDDPGISFNGTPWHPETNPVQIGALPDAANARLNGMVGDAKENIARIQKDPNLLKDAFLSNVPTTLFLLLPLFALLLKIAYLFKQRIYMEHLVVALHSHGFLCAGLLLVLLLDALKGWTAALPWLSSPLGWVEVALIAWMPLYLLLMQKRVYGQGWPLTLLKYGVLGTCYFVLVGLGATLSLLVSLVNM